MDIRNTKRIGKAADARLENAPGEKKISAVYAGIAIGINLLVIAVSYVLGLQIDQSGGLSKMGLRTTLSTIQAMLPILQTLVLMCLELGYGSAMLRIARGQYASPNSLRLGFDRFWTLIRQQLILSLYYMGAAFVAVYVSSMIYALTPLSRPAMELLSPLMAGTSIMNPDVVIDEGTYSQIVMTMVPAFLIMGVIFLALYIPMSYRYRMAAYVLIDKPGMGAMETIRRSRAMMRGNAVSLFKLDLQLWWYYAAMILASAVCYGDQILLLLGVELPISSDAAYFLFYGLYWALEFAIIYFLRAKVDVCYALAYDAIKPEERPAETGAVLGNIFSLK